MNNRLADVEKLFSGYTGIAIAAIIIAVVYYTLETATDASGNTASGAIPDGSYLSGNSEQPSAIPTGLNSLASNITVNNDQNTVNVPVGIFGLIGSVTNDLLGGAPQDFGTWAGEHISTADNRSLTNQSSGGNPFGSGPSNLYADAVNGSPIQATQAATPYVPDFGNA